MNVAIGMTIALIASVITDPARADCFDAAALYQHVDARILRAIAWQESHFQSSAIHRNSNGTVDYGMMQINSIHLHALSRYGVSSKTLMDPCASVYIAAWHLRSKVLKYGSSWMAIGAYHSESPAERDRYAIQIQRLLGRHDGALDERPANTVQ